MCLPGSQSVCTYLLIEMCVCCIKLGGFKLSDMYKMTLDNAHIRWSVKHPGAWRMIHIRSDICVKMDHLQSPKSRHSTIYTFNDFFLYFCADPCREYYVYIWSDWEAGLHSPYLLILIVMQTARPMCLLNTRARSSIW